MRIASLELIAYGPFRGLALDLDAPGIHVVYGRNEAGKSTTLRAITGLLYGIDRTTRDAHLHKPNELRIGGVLVDGAGKRLEVVRRKGNSNTLLDARGQVLDEDVMTRLLRGISEETFRHAFGLDHDALRRGAEGLLAGRGDLGESLFDASVGGGGEVQRLLERLEKEADQIYRPRGQSLPLNDAIRSYNEAQKAIRDKVSLPDAFVTQEKRLAELRAEVASLTTKKRELATRRGWLEAARQRTPLERRRTLLAAQRAELGAVAENVARLASLRERIGAYDVNVRAGRELGAELELLADRLVSAAERAGMPRGTGADAERAPRLDAKGEARLLRLVSERDTSVARIRELETELERARRELDAVRAAATTEAAAEADVDATALTRALASARSLGDVDARLASERAKVAKKRRDAETKAAQAGLAALPLEEVPRRPWPTLEVIDALGARAGDADKRVARAEDKVAELDAQVASLAQQIAAFGGDFAPPDAAALRAARDARDEAFTKLRAEVAAGADARTRVALESDVERALRAADELADRMIREADRVTNLARLRSAHATARVQLEDKRVEVERAKADRAVVDAELASAFRGTDLTVDGVLEARALVTKVRALVEQIAELRDLEHEVTELAARVDGVQAELAAALGADASGRGARPLAELVDAATARVDAVEARRRARENAAETARRLEETMRERETLLARERAALEDVRARLEELAGPLGIPADASTEEATRALEATRDLAGAIAKRAEVAAKAEMAGEEARAFEDDVARLVAALAPDLAATGLSPREAATELVSRATKADAVARDLASVEARLAELGDAALPEDVVAIAADDGAASRAIEELDAELAEVDASLTRANRDAVGVELGLAQMRSDSLAADEAARAQEALARVREHAERWCRAKVAATLLAREIDRFREENQGPLLARASSLFSRLTLGAYGGIRTGFDDKDKPCLLPVRSDGTEVRVDGLSEGTRDQLYLSLRLSALERHADVAEPMPLVLDDVLIQLDDDRARAALVVLGEMAQRTQILFFTHHARLVELARGALDASMLHVHELSARPAPAPTANV